MQGIHIAEVGANMLECCQLAPMHEAPNWQVNQLRKTQDLKALEAPLDSFSKQLKPYRK